MPVNSRFLQQQSFVSLEFLGYEHIGLFGPSL